MQIEITGHIAQKITDNAAVFLESSAHCRKEIARRLHIAGLSGLIEVEIGSFTLDEIVLIKKYALDCDERGVANRLASIINLKNNPLNTKVGSLKALASAMPDYLKREAIKGWLFKKEIDGTFMPWLVTDVKYAPRSKYSNEYVSIRLIANTAKTKSTSNDKNTNEESVMIHPDDIVKKTIGEILIDSGLCKETPELHATYEADKDKFIDYKGRLHQQFELERDTVTTDDTKNYWNQNRESSPVHKGNKLVNDESMIQRKVIDEYPAAAWAYDGKVDVEDKFIEVPYHFKLYFFNLNMHAHQWIHVSYVKPYQYKADLREKLVLPADHHDLIDILANDMNFIMEDIVDGKSGGTTILCKGSPGLGKTLTAEVYSEVIKKPLYRVHSGQLGVDAVSVEKNLNTILTRAERWGCVMLLDEADVYVRRRADDIQHNAVVASFLRTLEYFSGLLFMTTNRKDDVDDAILSRCIAVIEYKLPELEDAKKIWKVLSTQYGENFSDNFIESLAETYKTASGRDIKELLKLTLKFCKGKNLVPELDTFRRCAMFRGLI